jgi:hypothetical protein
MIAVKEDVTDAKVSKNTLNTKVQRWETPSQPGKVLMKVRTARMTTRVLADIFDATY